MNDDDSYEPSGVHAPPRPRRVLYQEAGDLRAKCMSLIERWRGYAKQRQSTEFCRGRALTYAISANALERAIEGDPCRQTDCDSPPPKMGF